MKKSTRRYLFLDFADLKNIKFRKLEKVCDRLFVFVRKEEKYIPVDLVQKMQRFGKNAKWVVVSGLDIIQNTNYHISFFMGKLHERIDTEIEFAVLSNDEDFDPLINYINSQGGRSCLRVKGKNKSSISREARRSTANVPSPQSYTLVDEMKSEEDLSAEEERSRQPVEPTQAEPAVMVSAGYDDDLVMSDEPVVRAVKANYTTIHGSEYFSDDDDKIVNRTAEETVERLVRSGNRPALVSTLKNYILLHNQELTVHGNINTIIERMQKRGQIEVNKEEVIYHF